MVYNMVYSSHVLVEAENLLFVELTESLGEVHVYLVSQVRHLASVVESAHTKASIYWATKFLEVYEILGTAIECLKS